MLRDMVDIVSTIRGMAVAAVNAQQLCLIKYGTVESVAPLKIRVEQKLLIEQEQLELTRAVMDYEVEMVVDHKTEVAANHSHEYKGRKKFLILNGLQVGDKVTMIRQHGGQQYLVIDKEES